MPARDTAHFEEYHPEFKPGGYLVRADMRRSVYAEKLYTVFYQLAGRALVGYERCHRIAVVLKAGKP